MKEHLGKCQVEQYPSLCPNLDGRGQARRAGKFFTTATQNWCPDKFSVPTEA